MSALALAGINPLRREWRAFWLRRLIAHKDLLEEDLAEQLAFQIASLTAQKDQAAREAARARHDLAALLRG